MKASVTGETRKHSSHSVRLGGSATAVFAPAQTQDETCDLYYSAVAPSLSERKDAKLANARFIRVGTRPPCREAHRHRLEDTGRSHRVMDARTNR
jgi:hypothetical protein